ncbi:MAG: nucleotidyl transferase AbiEii/AbiGii toxin family protein [Clostridia bacterium]|nr:nucleotidyl transferase AbiEii/AbiGii toxin family protein [Clostridia bacterium]
MNTLLEQMIQTYNVQTVYDQKNVMKEVMQEVVLCELSRAGFFSKAAFYGGTALRIFYGLDRFSEDLDFSLMHADDNFEIQTYFPALERAVKAYGMNVTIENKNKVSDSNIQSAFLKAGTKEHLLMFYPMNREFSGVANNEMTKIKFEVDVNPPEHATFERKYRLQPVPYEVNLYDASSLFAGKLHAVIGRAWKSRVKGRDLYDYVFYLSKGLPFNRKHLRARLIQSGHIKDDTKFALSDIKRMLNSKFDSIDFKQAKEDIAPFIRDTHVLDIWSADFFKQISDGLTEREAE